MVFRKNVLEYIIALVVAKNKVRLKKCLKELFLFFDKLIASLGIRYPIESGCR
jgi:hypothetical protein